MSEFVERVRALIRAGDVRISEHGYDELAEDGLAAWEVLSGVADAAVVEEYPDYPKGHVFYSYKGTETEHRFMPYGVSQEVMRTPWS